MTANPTGSSPAPATQAPPAGRTAGAPARARETPPIGTDGGRPAAPPADRATPAAGWTPPLRLDAVPRRCVNLPPGSLATLVGCALTGRLRNGPDRVAFDEELARWLGAPHVVAAESGRAAFQLALEALALERGKEIIVPAVTFPVMPMVIKMLGYVPVFCDVDPDTYNAGPEQFRARMTDDTVAILATHLFGQPCPIEEVAELARSRGVVLLEDCAHACGVRIGGVQAGTFGDVGIYSFAEGKNMPCFGGGALAIRDDQVAARARALVDAARPASAASLAKGALAVWAKWLLTRPYTFGVSALPMLRLRQRKGQPLLDSAVGDELLERFARSNPSVVPFSNLQASIGRRQLRRIDRFNEGARRNAQILTEALRDVPGVRVPRQADGNIYVYYPLTVDPDRRDDLRHYLLLHGVDTKKTDMSSCASLAAFAGSGPARAADAPAEAALLEICVYPVLSERQVRRIASVIRAWAGNPPANERDRAT